MTRGVTRRAYFLDLVDHVIAQLCVEGLVRGSGVALAPGPQEELSVRVEVYGADDGGVALEVVDDVLCLKFRLGTWSSIILSTAVSCLLGEELI